MAYFHNYAETTTANSPSSSVDTPTHVTEDEAEDGPGRLHAWFASSAPPKRCPCTGAFVLETCPCADAALGCKMAASRAGKPGKSEWTGTTAATETAETFGPYTVTRDCDPFKGDRFLILEKSSGRCLVSRKGSLRLVDGSDADSSWVWLCVSKDGFLGFQNTKEWTYLGRDGGWNFKAVASHHKAWEYFKTEKRRQGGYWIQHLSGGEFWQVSALASGNGLEAERRDGTVWEFIRVHDDSGLKSEVE